jgi:hypothetical protein
MMVAGTARIPTSTRRMTGGSAKITAAKIAVMRDASNRIRAGRR